MRAWLRLTLALLVLLAASSAPRADEDYHTYMYRGIQGHWREAGAAPTGWDITPDLVQRTDHDGKIQRYLGFRLNGNVNPPWLDLLYKEDGQVKIALGIAHLRDGRLIWAVGESADVKTYAAARGNLPGRPADFNAPKAVRHMLVRPLQNPRW